MKDILFFNIRISPVLYAPVVYFLWVSVLLLVKKYIYGRIEKLAAKTASKLDDILLGAMNFPLVLLIFVSGAFIIQKLLPINQDPQAAKCFLIAFKVTVAAAAILFLDNLISNLIKVYSEKIDILKTSGGIVKGFVRILIIFIGLLILLDSFGVSITPILASLGIGSLAVALALQPTLENFFSGIHLVADKSIKIGQFIKLESGEEGYVENIGWRSTWIRMLSNNSIVLPNKILVNSKVINYNHPEKETAVCVEVGVHYMSDLNKVEAVTCEVAKKVMETVPGGVPDFKPFIRYHDFSDFSIDFTVILRAKMFPDNYLIKHDFIKQLHERYKKEGIVIPCPVRAVNYDQEKRDK